jgi:serine/threonine-protein kinase ATR
MKINQISTQLVGLETKSEVNDFIISILERYLVPSFKSANSSKRHSLVAYTIQELLKLLNFTPAILGDIRQTDSRQLWKSFSKDVIVTLEPLLESRYSINQPECVTTIIHPIFSKVENHKDWIRQWIFKLCTLIPQDFTKDVFNIIIVLINDYDTTLATLVFPALFFHALSTSESNHILEECLCVLHYCGTGINQHSVQVFIIFTIDYIRAD